jgi:hypothetical protein
MKLKIRSVPDGVAPLSIREKWIGVEIEVDPSLLKAYEAFEKSGLPNLDGIGGGTTPPGCRPVFFADAMDALRAKGKYWVADYWEHAFGTSLPVLAFDQNCCEVI